MVLVRFVLGEESALPARNVSVPHPEGWAVLLRQVGGVIPPQVLPWLREPWQRSWPSMVLAACSRLGSASCAHAGPGGFAAGCTVALPAPQAAGWGERRKPLHVGLQGEGLEHSSWGSSGCSGFAGRRFLMSLQNLSRG